MTSSKEHHTGVHWFDALVIVKVTLPSSFSSAIYIYIYLGSYFHYLEWIMLVSMTKLMASDDKDSNLG